MNWKKLLLLFGILGLGLQQVEACPLALQSAEAMAPMMEGHQHETTKEDCADGEECLLEHEIAQFDLATTELAPLGQILALPTQWAAAAVYPSAPPRGSPRLEANPNPPAHQLFSRFISLLL